ncbi:MAG: efflux RND transporter permease subunit [Candidatus Cryptobacteroides sp.]
MKLHKHRGIGGFVQSAILHNKTVYAVTALVVIFGIIGLVYMKKEEFPSFTIKQGLVVGVCPGASAAEVEERLTAPIEEILFSFPEVDREKFHSVTRDGMCFIFADLDCRPSEKDEIWSRIKLRLNDEKMNFPQGTLGVLVKDDFNSISSLLIAIESDDKGYRELEEYADNLSRSLRRIPDVAKVGIVGEQKEEIAVTVDRDRLSAYGISPMTLSMGYQTESFPLSGGTFSRDFIDAPVHVYGNASTEKEISEKIVYAGPTGDIIRLKDIATVERRYKSPEQSVTYNGHACLVLSVEMRHGKNIVAFGKEVDKVLSDFSEQTPDSVKISRIADLPKVVGNSVTSFLRDLAVSMLVVILVMLMLFPLKSAVIAGSGVPVCTLMTIAVMYLTGMELHTVTLAALIVVLGMIVDNSIITMDGYMDKLGKGMGRVDAACASIKELFAPTLAATLAISAMFFPLIKIITGYLGEFVRLFPWVVAIALLISLVYAVTVVPSLEVRYISSASSSGDSFLTRAQNTFFKWMQKGYDALEKFCFRHPKLTIISGIAAVALGCWMFSTLNVQMMPKAARDFFAVEMELEGGNGYEQTKAVSDSLERILLADPRVKSVTAFVGTGAPRFNATYPPIVPAKTAAQLIVNTASAKATEELIRECDSRYEHHFPNAVIRFKQMDYQDVEAPIMVTLKGEDRNLVGDAADRITAYMYTLGDEIKWIHSNAGNMEPAVAVKLDADEAGRLGVNKAFLSVDLAGTFDGQNIATVWEGGNEISVNLYSDGSAAAGFGEIGSQMVATGLPGVDVPLRQVASTEPQWAPVALERRGGEQSVTIFADMKYGKSQPAAMKKIMKYIDEQVRPSLPEGYEIKYEGLTQTNRDLIPEVVLAVFCAVFILFIFMVFHFKKISLAFLTLILSSLCFFGAFFGLWIFDLDFGLTAILGVISLIGIIVRNGILMFEYAEELRAEGASVKAAAMMAGARRMRPIFLTSCTTALGVLPMVIGGDLLWQPMGVVICFGTLLSILLIVLIMPVSYWQVFKGADNKR